MILTSSTTAPPAPFVDALCRHARQWPVMAAPGAGRPSAVLLLLGPGADGQGPCVILNKRSRHVRQPGDLCCPGGGVHPILDRLLAPLTVPLTHDSLSWRDVDREWKRRRWPVPLRHLLATALREAFEEMRLCPVHLSFLGILAPERLVMFRRSILPFVAWLKRPQVFQGNGEVERVVSLPLAYLTRPEHHRRYILRYDPAVFRKLGRDVGEFPAIRVHHEGGPDILWGATYRMLMRFLWITTGFAPPVMSALKPVTGRIGGVYLTGESDAGA